MLEYLEESQGRENATVQVLVRIGLCCILVEGEAEKNEVWMG